MLANQIPVLAILMPTLLFIIFVETRGRHSSRFRRRCFLTRYLPRSPGESLRIELEQLNRDTVPYAAATLTFPLLIWSACLSLGNERTLSAMVWLVVDTTAVTASIVYVAGRLSSLLKRRRGLVVELETRMAVAEELNALAHKGYTVFHDVPAIGFNIAHVVVGETGVFAIETRGITGPGGHDDDPSWDVVYSGDSLNFPGWQETRAIRQAIAHAAWLQDWLSGVLDSDVAVQPVLVLPGWYIDQDEDGPVWVSNGKNMQALLCGAASRPALGGKALRHIAARLGQRCRLDSTRSARYLSDFEQGLIAGPA